MRVRGASGAPIRGARSRWEPSHGPGRRPVAARRAFARVSLPHRRHRRLGRRPGGAGAVPRHVPASGAAFVVVQHLDPDHKGMMPELLQRATAMPVAQASNRMKVKPDCVYVIPPNRDLSILHGSLYLLDPVAPRGLRLPIDFFFRALADDRREQAIGVILSGMGSDGTLGLRAIKEHGGLALVQDPATRQVRQHAAQRHRGRPGRHRRPGRGRCRQRIVDTCTMHAARRCPARLRRSARPPPRERPRQDLHPAARAHRPRFLALQEQHPLSPHRAAHGHPSARPHRRLRALPAREPAGSSTCCSRNC